MVSFGENNKSSLLLTRLFDYHEPPRGRRGLGNWRLWGSRVASKSNDHDLHFNVFLFVQKLDTGLIGKNTVHERNPARRLSNLIATVMAFCLSRFHRFHG